MIIPVKTSQGKYDILLERGALSRIDEVIDLNRRVLVVTDTGVPKIYAETVLNKCRDAVLYTFPEGEEKKNLDTLKSILEVLLKGGFTRSDCIVAVGGGVVGDISGFAASVFMRGIDFYNVPTTLLSQVDSSIGGKTAIDFMGIKNVVGAFYPPKAVVIDPDTLKTLPARQISNGLAEAIKMSATSDRELFEYFERADTADEGFFDFVITRSLMIKKKVVEEDERESGLRRVLNFGHTLAHAIESVCGFGKFYHGECVALGMIFMSGDDVRCRLEKILEKFSLPTEYCANADELLEACRHDKKLMGDKIALAWVERVGEFEFRTVPFSELEKIVCEVKK